MDPVTGLVSLVVTSAAFASGAVIPVQHTCSGADRSPPLAWSEPPAGTRALAVVCHDPDAPAGDWSHWVLFNLPPETRQLPEGVPAAPAGPGGSVQGINDFGRPGYGGPCPPPGKPHRYFFRVYALNAPLPLDAAAERKDVLAALKGRLLAHGELMGTFQRTARR